MNKCETVTVHLPEPPCSFPKQVAGSGPALDRANRHLKETIRTLAGDGVEGTAELTQKIDKMASAAASVAQSAYLLDRNASSVWPAIQSMLVALEEAVRDTTPKPKSNAGTCLA